MDAATQPTPQMWLQLTLFLVRCLFSLYHSFMIIELGLTYELSTSTPCCKQFAHYRLHVDHCTTFPRSTPVRCQSGPVIGQWLILKDTLIKRIRRGPRNTTIFLRFYPPDDARRSVFSLERDHLGLVCLAMLAISILYEGMHLKTFQSRCRSYEQLLSKIKTCIFALHSQPYIVQLQRVL